jgi:hypothetical protein
MKRLKPFYRFGARFLLIAVFVISFAAGFITPAAAASADGFGAVYTSTNAMKS